MEPPNTRARILRATPDFYRKRRKHTRCWPSHNVARPRKSGRMAEESRTICRCTADFALGTSGGQLY